MKKLLSILTLTFGIMSLSYSQNTFNWTDNSFQVGQTRNIRLLMAFDGPCTAKPCYDYSDNKQTYDTLVTFLLNNKDVSLAFIWHTGTAGSSRYNFYYSKRVAEGLIKELIRLGISEKRMTAIGLGESRPIVSEEELKTIEDKDERLEADRQNNRIEIIITSAPNEG